MAVHLSSTFTHFYSREASAFFSQSHIQSAGTYLLGAFIICFCASAILRRVNTAPTKPMAVVEIIEKRSKGNVKEDFGESFVLTISTFTDIWVERSRRACSVPLDCECAWMIQSFCWPANSPKSHSFECTSFWKRCDTPLQRYQILRSTSCFDTTIVQMCYIVVAVAIFVRFVLT